MSGQEGPTAGGEATAMESREAQDAATMQQVEQLTSEIAATQPLISDPVAPGTLRREYEGNPLDFGTGIDYLDATFTSLRRVRGDGNCFYRSYLFRMLERLVLQRADAATAEAAEAERQRLLRVITGSKETLVALGYSEIAFESFLDMFVAQLEGLFDTDAATLLETFREDGGTSEYLVWFTRLLTAASMKLNPDAYLPFVEAMGFVEISAFCGAEVEPMGKECEQIQIQALVDFLDVGVRILYLDGREFTTELPSVTMPETCAEPLELLYRPGHFDILMR